MRITRGQRAIRADQEVFVEFFLASVRAVFPWHEPSSRLSHFVSLSATTRRGGNSLFDQGE
jgi:hypothetical protein